jgi:hypothetical protein
MMLLVVTGLLYAVPAGAAEYKGRTVDQLKYEGRAFSFGTGKHYDVTYEFDGDEVTLTFEQGATLVLTLDDEEIEDPDAIDASDENGTSWELEVEDLD